jgi:hypothetical protein
MDITEDTLIIVLCYLENRSLCSASRTCKYWYKVAKHNAVIFHDQDPLSFYKLFQPRVSLNSLTNNWHSNDGSGDNFVYQLHRHGFCILDIGEENRIKLRKVFEATQAFFDMDVEVKSLVQYDQEKGVGYGYPF